MRVIYLTLATFILLGIGAACRTPGLMPDECAPDATEKIECRGERP